MDSVESLRHQLHQLEKRLLQPEVRRFPSELTRLLADEFVEFGSSGQVYDRQTIIESLSKETTIEISITGFKMVVLTPGVALVTYRAVCISEGDESPVHSLRSSIWKLADSRWQMVFHQGTPTSVL